MFQLHSSHHQAVYVRSIRGNFIAVAYIRLKLISGSYFGITYKDTRMLHIKKCIQYTSCCIRLSNRHIF